MNFAEKLLLSIKTGRIPHGGFTRRVDRVDIALPIAYAPVQMCAVAAPRPNL